MNCPTCSYPLKTNGIEPHKIVAAICKHCSQWYWRHKDGMIEAISRQEMSDRLTVAIDEARERTTA